MPDVVDLRSDTVTRPTPEMRRAMAEAEVGDDVYGEDPTVRRLEETYAGLVGKPAGLFVPSGIMANQIALRLLTRPGDAVVAGRRQHVVAYESGAGARNAGIQFVTVPDDDGILEPAALRWSLAAADHHQPRPALVCVENTHMPADGAVWTLRALDAAGEAAAGLPVHMDGARLFNAVVASGVTAADFAARATTVMSCLSKGLGAPVGSVLAGPAELMAEARLLRSGLGGGMRQAGILAAAGLVALERMVDRLAEDHSRARLLAEALAERFPGDCQPERVVTNIVTCRHPRPEVLVDHLGGLGVLAGTIAPGVLRLVTHKDIDDAGVERACAAIASAP